LKNEELLKALFEANRRKGNQVSNKILEQILSIAILNPLVEDRARSQEQIKYILTKSGEEKNEDNKD
jgi:hypothetical protein